ncbi:hypothetical protein YB2330_004736 [Saitoella coloradoensis]
MLPRKPTAIKLAQEDIFEYDDNLARKRAEEAAKRALPGDVSSSLREEQIRREMSAQERITGASK